MNQILVTVLTLAIVTAHVSGRSLPDFGFDESGRPRMVQLCGSQLIDFVASLCDISYRQRKMRNRRGSEELSDEEKGADGDDVGPMTHVSDDNKPKIRHRRSLTNNCCKNACRVNHVVNYC